MERPSRAKANRDPTAILRAHTQQCRTSAQKKADNAIEAIATAEKQQQVAKEHQEKIKAIAAMEDQLCKDDIKYVASMKWSASSTKKTTNLPQTVCEPDEGTRKGSASLIIDILHMLMQTPLVSDPRATCNQ